MKKKPFVHWFSFICILLILVISWRLWFIRNTDKQPVGNPDEDRAALTVTLTYPQQQWWPETLSANGNITAWQEAVVGAGIGGLRLLELKADIGDQVYKGQLLARLQDDTIRAEQAQTRANLVEAQAALREASANADRARRLRDKGTMSEQQSTAYLIAEQTAQARVDALQARQQSDQIHLDQTRILAPDDGTITTRSATLGAVVQTGDVLYRLIRGDRLEWRGELTADEMASVHHGMQVELTTTGGQKLAGTVRQVAPTLDESSRNGLVYVDLPANSGARAGMFARGKILLARKNMLTVPQSALLLRDGFHYLFHIDRQQHLIQRKVTPGMRLDNRVAILDNLDRQEPVVDSGVGFLYDGDPVHVVSAASDTFAQETQP